MYAYRQFVQASDLGRKVFLSDFKCDMVVGDRQSGLSISQTADLLGFFHKTISRVYTEWSEKDHSVLFLGENA